MIPNRNILWGRVVAEEVARSGVRHVCLAPGSRSGPLAFGLHEQRGLRLSTHIDERAMGYFALGIAKATHRPVALVTTSGTAVANLLPAIVEANQSRVPLLALTADRPPELQDVGANQAITQRAIFGSFVRFFSDTGIPEPVPSRVRHLRALVGRAVAFARGPPAGPVHLNFPFREPLDPQVVEGDVPSDWAKGDLQAEVGRADGQPFLAPSAAARVPAAGWVENLARVIQQKPAGVIAVGPRWTDDGLPRQLVELSHRTGFPILADALSGARYGPTGPRVLSAYDSFLAHGPTRGSLRADVILRFGLAPTSKALTAWLRESTQALQVLFDESGRLGEETSRAHWVYDGDATSAAQALKDALPAGRVASSEWRPRWDRLEAAAWRVLEAEIATGGFEGAEVARLVQGLDADSLLFVSNSLPVRDLERFARADAKPLRVLANRGASGIDGILSTALGAGHGLGRRVTIAMGDLAFLHDVNGLAAIRRLGIPADILLLNNDGGGIFEFLPAREWDPPFTELFVTPHGMRLAPLAEAFGMEHRRLDASRRTDWTFQNARVGEVVEVVSDRKINAARRREIEERIAAELASEAIIPAG